MRVVVALEHRFSRLPAGTVGTETCFDYQFWTRYLDVFDEVRVVARVRNEGPAPAGLLAAEGPGVSFAAVPNYVGPWQYACRFNAIRRVLSRVMRREDAIILRVSSVIGSVIERRLRSEQHPYGLEVVGDPHETFARGAVHHPLRPVFQVWFYKELRRLCQEACGVAYVTERALQRRYPPGGGAFATHYSSYYSDIELSDGVLVTTSRPSRPRARVVVITVGSLAQLYKGPDLLIEAIGLCVRQGLDAHLVIVGEGKHRRALEDRAVALGIGSRVRFTGQLPAGEAVRQELDKADLFVLASRTEGLPRAMIEAMARGLPCIGASVGGIPELLLPDVLVPRDDVRALAGKISEVAGDPDRMARMSARNLVKAAEYREEVLRVRRRDFYRYVRRTTEDWLVSRAWP